MMFVRPERPGGCWFRHNHFAKQQLPDAVWSRTQRPTSPPIDAPSPHKNKGWTILEAGPRTNE